VPPLTGASSMAMSSAARRSAKVRAANGSMVDMQSTMCLGLAPRMMPCAPMITDSACSVVSTMTMVADRPPRHRLRRDGHLGASGFQRLGLRLVDVVHHQRETGLRQVERHRPAHGAEPDESDLAGHALLPEWDD
jgi:hypothetical protein